MAPTRIPVLTSLALLTFSCTNNIPSTFTTGATLGGQQVSAKVLNQGQESYVKHCYACHGIEGDGFGPSAPGLRPPPRDFRTATFKFTGVIDGLPHDEDLVRIINSGLHGTAMLEWDLPPDDVLHIVQFIKTFSPEGEGWRDPDEVLGERMVPTTDPFGTAGADEAIARGRALYHGFTTCQSCHPAYATKQEMWDYSAEYDKVAEFRENLYLSEVKGSDYEVAGPDGEAIEVTILPPDFTWDKVRAVYTGHEHEDLYRIIAGGIGGTAMPAWKGSIEEEEIWALVYYVDSLIDIRDTAEATGMRQALASQPAFVPPPPPEEEGTGEEGAEATPDEGGAPE